MQSLTRRPDGTVELRSGKFALLFDPSFGGVPLQWWQDGLPDCLTNPWPGSGASIVGETGQDPTEASADGLHQHPIATLDGRNRSYDYYARETIFDPHGYVYGKAGVYPDFWLGAEGIDNYEVTGNWRSVSPALVFTGNNRQQIGLMYPGNEMEPGNPRLYARGRIAARTNVDFATTDKRAKGGLRFRADAKTQLGGYDLLIDKNGNWSLGNRKTWRTVCSGRVRTKPPYTLEIRTSVYDPSYLHVWINNTPMALVHDMCVQDGELAGICASATSGEIWFDDRRFYDLNMQFASVWRALPDERIESSLAILTTPGCEPLTWYRAGMIGIWMNLRRPDMFPVRRTGWKNQDGTFKHHVGSSPMFVPGREFWIGNPELTAGVACKPLRCEVDGKHADGAWVLLSEHTYNDEWVLGMHALPPDFKGKVGSAYFVAQWRTVL